MRQIHEQPSRGEGRLPNRETENPYLNPLTDVLVYNRGIIAGIAGEVGLEKGIRTSMTYSFSDPITNATLMADRYAHRGWKAIPIGGQTLEESYKNADMALEIARIAKAKAPNPKGFGVFLGYGGLSELEDVVARFEDEDIRVLAPSSRAMEKTGNKVNFLDFCRANGIPTLPSSGVLHTPEEAVKALREVGGKAMYKDATGGGGNRNLEAETEEEGDRAFKILKSKEGSGDIYAERLIKQAGHIEAQIVADDPQLFGNVVCLGLRDCTPQRRNQKFMEESPSPRISPKMAAEIQQAGILVARAAEYKGVGTFEAIIDMDDVDEHGFPKHWYAMEWNARPQVELRVTQMQTGINPVRVLYDVMENRPLPFRQEDIVQEGHTVEWRIYAEDPYVKDFPATPGVLQRFVHPTNKPGQLIFDTAYQQGHRISEFFDPTIGHLVMHGKTREGVLIAGHKQLSSIQAYGETVTNNIPFLLETTLTPKNRSGKSWTTFSLENWDRVLQAREPGVKELGGVLTPEEPRFSMDLGLLGQDPRTPNRDPNKPPIQFSVSYRETQAKTGKDRAAEFGEYTYEGARFIMYHLNPQFRGGAVMPADAFALTDAVEKANDEGLPLVMDAQSGGMDQDGNMEALIQMRKGRKDVRKLKGTHYTVLRNKHLGGAFGSFEQGDLIIGVDDKDTRAGITGPNSVFAVVNKTLPEARDAETVYEQLGDAHAVTRHFRERSVDIMVPTPQAAMEKIAHIEYVLNAPSTQESSHVFRPRENIRSYEVSRQIPPFNNPDALIRAWHDSKIGSLWDERFGRRRQGQEQVVFPGEYDPIPLGERLAIIEHGDRPTAADLIDIQSGLFDDAVLLSTRTKLGNGGYQYPSTIAAVARIEDIPVLVLAHQPQRVKDEKTGRFNKAYDPQRPKDLIALGKILNGFGRKNGLPVLTLTDTDGLSSRPEDEDQFLEWNLANFLDITEEYPFPIIAANIGLLGSGGGLTLYSTFDAAAMAENARNDVSHPRVNYLIKTKRWIGPNDPPKLQKVLMDYAGQFTDASAEWAVEHGFADAILKEGKGGAHRNPRILASQLRQFVLPQLRFLKTLSSDELLDRRERRLDKAAYVTAVPNPKYRGK